MVLCGFVLVVGLNCIFKCTFFLFVSQHQAIPSTVRGHLLVKFLMDNGWRSPLQTRFQNSVLVWHKNEREAVHKSSFFSATHTCCSFNAVIKIGTSVLAKKQRCLLTLDAFLAGFGFLHTITCSAALLAVSSTCSQSSAVCFPLWLTLIIIVTHICITCPTACKRVVRIVLVSSADTQPLSLGQGS